MRSEVEVFAVNASNSNHAILNRWVIYAADNNHEVYLETTKNYKISKESKRCCRIYYENGQIMY